MNTKLSQKEKWQLIQDRLAEGNGLAVVIADENSPELAKANNNSVCEVLYNSKEFAPECAKFCGKAFDLATEAGKTVEYKCYAGLNCLAVPVKTETKPLVAIVGRIFLKAEDYRNATKRAISGDWRKFPPTKFFENVLLSGSTQNMETAAKQIENLDAEERDALLQRVSETRKIEEPRSDKASAEGKNLINLNGEIAAKPAEKSEESEAVQTKEIEELVEQPPNAAERTESVSENFDLQKDDEAEKISQWRSLLGSLLDQTYAQACESILRFIARRYAISSLAWLERRGNRLEAVFASGNLKEKSLQLGISADDKQLLDAVKREIALELRERRNDAENNRPSQTIQLFPIAVGGEIRSALIIGDEISGKNKKRQISRLCQTFASELEILRLREELNRRDWMERAVQRFSESVKDIDTDNFWLSLTQISAELMRAERASLLVFDEKSKSLSAKAATGAHADRIEEEREHLGEKIAQNVLQTGKPLLIRDIQKTEISAAPAERSYKSNSFISYPINIGRRKIGVLNVTDRVGGGSFDEFDLEILNAIMPHLAVLIDRALLKHRAGEFEQLSVTDALTGLLNRLYLDERLPEEIRRSNREGFPMSFMMIDVDDFKSYNDNFGHAEGDKALKIVAFCLKDTLRAADVAARYGGEEFSILLPQTTSDEAAIIAERIREKVASTEFPNRQVTISIGIASCPNGVCAAPQIVKWADDALYEAKRRGRNNVQVFENL